MDVMIKYIPDYMRYGRLAVEDFSEDLARLGGTALIVTGGKSAVLSGALDDVTAALDRQGVAFEVFDEITQNPLTEDCHTAGRMARNIGADYIIGIGGGSPLDAAKAVAIYAANEQLAPEDIYQRENCNPPLPVVLVGTTAGTGSEVTGVSVLTDSRTLCKRSISGKDCYAAIAFCDYRYTLSVPHAFTVSTALDALAHAVESYFSSIADEESEEYALEAAREIFECLKVLSSAEADEALRERLYAASLLAGLAINKTGCLFPHAVGYILTEQFGLPHGIACAVFMPELLSRAQRFCPEKFKRFFAFLETSSEEFICLVKSLSACEVKIDEASAKKFAARYANGNKNFDKSPGGLSADEAAKLLYSL